MSSARKLLRTLVLTGISVVLVAPAAAAHAQPSESELTARITKSSVELEKIVESYNRLNEEIKQTKASAAELSVKLGPLEEQLEQRRAEVGLLAAEAYKTGGLTAADALLHPGGDDLVARLGTVDHLIRKRERQIADFDVAQRELADQKAVLDSTLAKQTAQAKEIANGKKKIEADLAKLYDLRREAYGSPTVASSNYTGPIPSVSGQAGVAVTFAHNALGKAYSYGAAGPNGYDCSGLTQAAWKAAGKSLSHNAAMQWDETARISRSALKPGDLVFYRSLGHVGIYVGSGMIIHAPSAGDVVKKVSINIMTPYGYGRVR
nr:NlpC/P60 family protein [Micromonospora sp. DSM 115978]